MSRILRKRGRFAQREEDYCHPSIGQELQSAEIGSVTGAGYGNFCALAWDEAVFTREFFFLEGEPERFPTGRTSGAPPMV